MKYFVLLAGFGEMAPSDEQTPQQQEADMAKLAAFAEACAAGPGVEMLSGDALAGVDELLRDSHRFAAGELAHRAGDTELARVSSRMALELCEAEFERGHLKARLAHIQAPDR